MIVGGFCNARTMKDYAKTFYKSKQWQQCRLAYLKSVGGLCERCLAKGLIVPGKIVHHKIHLSPENIKNPHISLDWNNLELVCHQCHNEIHDTDLHKNKTTKRYLIDPNGKVFIKNSETQ